MPSPRNSWTSSYLIRSLRGENHTRRNTKRRSEACGRTQACRRLSIGAMSLRFMTTLPSKAPPLPQLCTTQCNYGVSEFMTDKDRSFFEHLGRLFAPSYIPSDQDILRSRLKTT